MPGPVIRNPKGNSWTDPEQGSVFDSLTKRIVRQVLGLLGANAAPEDQLMGVASPMMVHMPGASKLRSPNSVRNATGKVSYNPEMPSGALGPERPTALDVVNAAEEAGSGSYGNVAEAVADQVTSPSRRISTPEGIKRELRGMGTEGKAASLEDRFLEVLNSLLSVDKGGRYSGKR